MLWVDKHRPTSLESLDYGKEQAEQLRLLAATGDLPHMLFYGPAGAGKKTRIMALVRRLRALPSAQTPRARSRAAPPPCRCRRRPRVFLQLRAIFGPGVERVKLEHRTFKTPTGCDRGAVAAAASHARVPRARAPPLARPPPARPQARRRGNDCCELVPH
jgi:hypothetical protein